MARTILLSAPYDSGATDLFRRRNWKNLRNQRLFTKAIMMFKSGETPDYLSNKSVLVMTQLVIDYEIVK